MVTIRDSTINVSLDKEEFKKFTELFKEEAGQSKVVIYLLEQILSELQKRK